MLTLLGSLLGLFTSHLPEMLGMWKDKNKNNHDLEKLDKQITLEKLKNNHEIEKTSIIADAREIESLHKEASVGASLPKESAWVAVLSASVRPVITYSYFLLFLLVKVATLAILLREGSGFFPGLMYLWDTETKTLFATIMMYWFGHRALLRYKGQR